MTNRCTSPGVPIRMSSCSEARSTAGIAAAPAYASFHVDPQVTASIATILTLVSVKAILDLIDPSIGERFEFATKAMDAVKEDKETSGPSA